MVSIKKLIDLANKWRRMAAIKRKGIMLPGENADSGDKSYQSPAGKGHFIVYMADNKQYVLPISYQSSCIVRELFAMSEGEFGLPGHRLIMLLCLAVFMDYAVSLIQHGCATKDIEKV